MNEGIVVGITAAVWVAAILVFLGRLGFLN